MGLSLLDNILLSILSKTQGINFEEKIDNVKFVFFYSGMTLFFSGVVLILGPSFIGTVLLYFGAKVDLSSIYETLNIRAETLGGEKTVVSAKEPFSNKKLNNFRDKYIFIEASKEAETKIGMAEKLRFCW